MTFNQPPLPYAEDALEPVLSKQEVHLHYSKHEAKYFDTLNEVIKGTSFENIDSLDELVTHKHLARMDKKMFNNACQAWNHVFYWQCLCPVDQSSQPSAELLAKIKTKFGSFADFKKKFSDAAVDNFGSGWAWLIVRDNDLLIKTTPNARNPLNDPGYTPILTIDTWEHSWTYDEKYFGDKKAYVKAIWDILNWDFISAQFAKAVDNE